MNFFVIGSGFIFTICSGAILAYISIATMMGPWIAPTIVMVSFALFKIKQKLLPKDSSKTSMYETTMIQSISSVGGSIGTALGFALPMLFFLDKPTFKAWISKPGYFCASIAVLCICAGALGILLGRLYSYSLLTKLKLPFPVSQLTVNLIAAQNQTKQAWGIIYGMIVTALFLFLRDGIGKIGRFIPKIVYILPQYFKYEFAIFLWPTLWAIGFTSGSSIAMPMLVGVASKYLILWPLNNHTTYSPWHFFSPMPTTTFAFAFCCGIVLYELFSAIKHNFRNSIKFIKKIGRFIYYKHKKIIIPCKEIITGNRQINPWRFKIVKIVEPLLAVVLFVFLFTTLKFCITAQLLLIILVAIATYQICFLGGKIGLVHFGRFSTYVMVPMALFFNLSFLQITIVCVFFNICAAVASDLLFDYQTGKLCSIKQSKTHLAQWIGLITAALSIGFIFWIFFSNLTLGSPDFFAYRGRTKALLLQTFHFNSIVVTLGFIYGYFLKKIGLNPSIVFGGILMPNSISIGVILGSLSTLLSNQNEKHYPFCAGVFAGESLWVLGSLIGKLF